MPILYISFERIHRIPTKPTSQRLQVRLRPIIVRFSHFQDKEFVKTFLKNLKGTQIGVSDNFPKEFNLQNVERGLKKCKTG